MEKMSITHLEKIKAKNLLWINQAVFFKRGR
jgi:hypothetical protein